MKIKTLGLVLLTAVFGASCVKVVNHNVIGADNTAKIKMTVGYKLDAVDGLKGLIEQFVPGIEESDENPFEKIDEALAQFDEKKFVEGLKEAGVEVTKSFTVEKDGWKLVEVEGAVKDVNAWMAKSAENMKKSAEKAAEEGMPNLGNMPFHFYKTAEADVAKLVIMPPLGDLIPPEAEAGFDQIEEMDDEMREQIEGMLDMVRAAISLDQMRMEMKFQLPGKITSVKGCKQEGEDTIVFSMKGSDIGLDGVKDLFGLKNGVHATFKFDPQTFKIKLEDEKVAESRGTTPSKATEDAEKAKKKNEEEEKKKGEDG